MIADIVVMASDGVPAWILAAGPAGGAHAFERDTIIKAKPAQGTQDVVDHISRTRDSDIDGDNSSAHRKRVQRMP